MASGIIFVGKTPERTETNVANIFAGTVVTDQSISQKKQEEKNWSIDVNEVFQRNAKKWNSEI